jgi:hypothetical protein
VAIAIAMAFAFLVPSGVRRLRRWWYALVPLVPAYAVLAWYGVSHQGALTGRYGAIGIGYDSPGVFTLVGRFLGNYATYWGFPFLITHGDANPRHNTQFGGMLLAATLPAIVLGAAICVRRIRSDPFCRVLVLGALFAPAPAALTAEGTPHSLRAVLMLPFLLAFSAYGWQPIAEALRSRRVVAAALGVAVLVESGGYFYDMFVQYPGRVVAWFDTGEGPSIARAAQIAADRHEVFLSTTLDAPYIQALFYLKPDPNAYVRDGMETLHMRVEPVDSIGVDAARGDLMVLSASDPIPSGAQVLFVDQATVGTGPPDVTRPPTQQVQLVVVAQR